MVSKIPLGTCRWTNKEHFPVGMYSSSMRGTKVAATEGQWLLSKLPECSAPKNPDSSFKAHVHCPYIPPTLCISTIYVTSLNYVTIICFPLLTGKALCMHRRVTPVHLWTCQHPHWLFSTATHKPSSQLHIPNFEPVTLPQVLQCTLIPEPKIY